jgi:transcriptional regulator with XRE-family HTH domain
VRVRKLETDPMDARGEICARIREARQRSGLTQEEMAQALGITTRAYFNYEHVRVPFRLLRKIAELTSVSDLWLLSGSAETGELTAETVARLERRVEELHDQVGRVLALLGELRRLDETAQPQARREST